MDALMEAFMLFEELCLVDELRILLGGGRI